MPHFNVQIVEEALDGEAEPKIIRALTDAVVKVFGEWAHPLVVVELFGIPRRRWGLGGAPAERNLSVVTLNMREPAFSIPTIDNPPAQLIATITDAMTEVFGQSIREHLNVLLVGVPTGRSGVGGEIV